MTNRLAAVRIIKRLRKAGFEALLAGGCVRDMLLCRSAKDYDVATNARPKDVMRLFKRTLKVGARFGVVIVLIENRQVEVATFRTESGYIDGRHPEQVRFSHAAEDAARRDFTINGMFYDPVEKKVIDYVGGRQDLAKRIVRTIGDPRLRFSEDYLRMLRAVRFATQLRFTIEPQTMSAIRAHAAKITGISGERIRAELEAVLVDSNRTAGILLLDQTRLAVNIFPTLRPAQIRFAVRACGKLPAKVDFPLALATFFAGCETDFALEKCRVLKLSRDQTKHIRFLLANRGKLLDPQMSLARLKMLLAEPYFGDLFELQKAIQKAVSPGRRSIEPLIKLKRRIKALGDVELQPARLLDGHELMRLGVPVGPVLGQVSREMYIAQLEGKITTKDRAKQWVRDWLKTHRLPDR